MKVFNRGSYDLLIGENSLELFEYLGVENLHGLNKSDCLMYKETSYDTYISGMSNYYPSSDRFYCFINKSRLNSKLDSVLIVNHELLHVGFYIYNWDIKMEEEIISWAEEETRKIFIEEIFNQK